MVGSRTCCSSGRWGNGSKSACPLQGYMHHMKKTLAEAAYEKVFMQWIEENLLGVELEISSKPPTTKEFVPVCGWEKELLVTLVSSED